MCILLTCGLPGFPDNSSSAQYSEMPTASARYISPCIYLRRASCMTTRRYDFPACLHLHYYTDSSTMNNNTKRYTKMPQLYLLYKHVYQDTTIRYQVHGYGTKQSGSFSLGSHFRNTRGRMGSRSYDRRVQPKKKNWGTARQKNYLALQHINTVVYVPIICTNRSLLTVAFVARMT